MVKVQSFHVAGVRCWFWSGDHLPPHFHLEAENGDWNAKVFFLLDGCQMIQDIHSRKSGGIPAGIRKVLQEMVRKNLADLLRQWEELHGGEL